MQAERTPNTEGEKVETVAADVQPGDLISGREVVRVQQITLALRIHFVDGSAGVWLADEPVEVVR